MAAYKPGFTSVTSGRSGRFMGGTGGGGIVYLPPELDMSDWNQGTAGFTPSGVSISQTYAGIACRTWWGAGIADPRGGTIRTGWSWGEGNAELALAGTSGWLLFRRHSIDISTISINTHFALDTNGRPRFVNTSQTNWSIFDQATMTADRTYTWPDKDGTVGILPIVLTSGVSGILPIANGGTNASTALNNSRIMVSSAGAIVEAAVMTNGQLLIGSTGAAPVVAGLTAGTNITITPGAGTIEIAAAGGTGAPVAAQYLTLALHADLTAERLFTPSDGLAATDGGANGNYTLKSKSFTVSTHDGETIGDTTTETTGPSIVVPAGTLDTDEQILYYRCRVNAQADGNDTLAFRFKFAGTTYFTWSFSPGAAFKGGWIFEAVITRTSSTTASIEARIWGANNYNYTWQDYTNEVMQLGTAHTSDNYDDDSAVTWANANTFEITGDWVTAPGLTPSIEFHHGFIQKVAA